jgi:transposase-like protein
MDARRFARLKACIGQGLTAPQCLELADSLRHKAQTRMSDLIIGQGERMVREDRKCRHCGHDDIVLHGRDENGRQRFRCRKSERGGCGRTFNGLTNTVLAHMRKPELWLTYADTMPTHLSVKKTAEKVGVSHVTAHRWRLRLLEVQAVQEAKKLTGVIEADETFFRDSFKGSRGWKRGAPPAPRTPRYRGSSARKPGLSAEQVPVLTAVDRSDGVVDRVLESRSGIARAMPDKVERGSVVCSDGLAAYVEVARASGSEHRRIDPPRKDWLAKAKGDKPRRRGVLGLGRVNAHHQRQKQLINGECRGVATKNLHAYLGWNRAVRRNGFAPVELIADPLIHRYV